MSDFATKAIPLNPEGRGEAYRDVSSFRALRAELRRGYSTKGWLAAGAMTLVSIGLGVGWLSYPVKEVKIVYLDHDRTTGWIGPAIGVHDAPKTWGVKEFKAALTEYIWARERYTPEIDQMNWSKVRAMTSAPEWRNFIEWVDGKTSPKSTLKRDGHVDVWNLSFINPNRSPDGTWTYQVSYNRRVVKPGASDPPTYTCNTQISFRLQPELKQTEIDAILNPYGLQVFAYRQPEPAENCR